MHWHLHDNKRQMPWKGEKDPYRVWLSEIILQQTRVEQGLGYYQNFILHYPTITSLAKAKDIEVFKLWEGLGYYNRCKNLLFTARLIAQKYNGVFPQDYKTILSLKGVGPYTAAAISSFCFNLPFAVVDGNVLRVLSRVAGIDTPVDGSKGKNILGEFADKILDKKNPGGFNQAIMDFGAVVCKPAVPLCSHCVLKKICSAYNSGRVNQLPVKEKILQKKTRWFTYFIFEKGEKTLVYKRTAKDIWQNLYEFYLLETGANPRWDIASVTNWCSRLNIKPESISGITAVTPQQLTHQLIKGCFISIHLRKLPKILDKAGAEWVNKTALKKLPFPKFINQYPGFKS